ncbi:MAG: DUF711 family protein, partial [Clostridia bacterium]|nr:DUF711 family protein [Clostridia bacterium]
MLNTLDIIETIKMITEEHLDIRTITMGISLMDCASEDMGRCAQKIYDKVCTRAEKLVSVGEDLEREYGIPVINKRVSVSPIATVAAACGEGNIADLARAMDRAAQTVGVNFIGGYSALVHKGRTESDRRLLNSIPEALSTTERVCSSVNVATTRAGINMDAVTLLGRIIKDTSYITRDTGSFGCAKLVVFANIPEDNPFMAGAYHGIGEAECAINVGVSGPGVVRAAILRHPDCNLT